MSTERIFPLLTKEKNQLNPCRVCGKIGGELNADHILPFAFFPDARFVVANGRTLCKKCHLETETWGGRAHKTLLVNN